MDGEDSPDAHRQERLALVHVQVVASSLVVRFQRSNAAINAAA